MLGRLCPRVALRVPSRTFTTSVVARKDFVQELYLRELKGYKAPPQAKDAHVGQVREFSAPASPKAPEVLSTSDLAGELEAYENEVPTLEAKKADSAAPETSGGADEFFESLVDRQSSQQNIDHYAHGGH